jgi:hypothetical protein
MQPSTSDSETLARPVTAAAPVTVTVDNFVRAETDMHFMLFARRGGFGKFHHVRDLPLENTGMRPSRDTLYSEAVFDLDAGPVSIALPPAGRRFMSMMLMDEDHYVLEVVYGSGKHTYTRGQVGTRYLFAAVRILVDPQDPEDIRQVRFLQDEIRVNQAQAGKLEMPPWDPASHGKVREALLTLRGSDRPPSARPGSMLVH